MPEDDSSIPLAPLRILERHSGACQAICAISQTIDTDRQRQAQMGKTQKPNMYAFSKKNEVMRERERERERNGKES